MALRCPECGGKRMVFASGTAAMAAWGGTDQRYRCKDCGYFGSLAVESLNPEPDEADKRVLEDLKNIKDEPDVPKTESKVPRALATGMVLWITVPTILSIIWLPLALLLGDLALSFGIAFAATVALFTSPIWYFKWMQGKP